MDVYVARQPIFDREMNVSGYELLYRNSMENKFTGIDDNEATAQVINNAFVNMHFDTLTSGTKAYINFSHEMLIDKVPLLLPKDGIVIEVLERGQMSKELLDVCRTYWEMGYELALDDFVFDESYLPLLDFAKMVKVEFPVFNAEQQYKLINQYNHKVNFLAEKVETREEYKLAASLGYDYFQGYFFSKPTIMKGKEIETLNASMLRVLIEINKENPKYHEIAAAVSTDVGLTYKLLKLVNSAYYGLKTRITSIKQALVLLGLEEIKKWIYVLILKETKNKENSELINLSLSRAKLMELISIEKGYYNESSEFFLVGMFSSMDTLMNQPMKEVLKDLPLTISVKDALLGVQNEYKEVLDLVLKNENAQMKTRDLRKHQLKEETFVELYVDSLAWVININI